MIVRLIATFQQPAIGRLPRRLPPVARPYLYLFSAWLFSLIALPIVNVWWGLPAVTWGISLSVVLQAGLGLFILQQAWGWVRTLRAALIVAALGLVIEAIGTATGLPFGRYTYTEALQPQLAHVPLLIPLAWLMMMPPAWAVAQRIAGPGPASRLSFIGLSALAMTAWDLFLDPQLVAWGFWVWAEPGGYFGIPWLNFFGWALTAALMTIIVRPAPLPTGPLLTIYGLTWILETIGLLVFWGLPGPALVGFAAMGGLFWLAVKDLIFNPKRGRWGAKGNKEIGR